MKDRLSSFIRECVEGSALNIVFILGLCTILLWLPLEYGARYISTQVAGQVICGALLLLLIREKNQILYKYPLWAISVFWIAVLFMSFAFSVTKLASLEELMRNVMYITLPMVIFSWCTFKSRIKMVSYLLVLTGSFIGIVALYMFFRNYIITGEFHAATGSFTRTNDLGAYMLLIFPLSFSNFLYENKSSAEKTVYGTAAILSFIVIVLSFSRGIWLSVLVALILIFILGRKIIRKNFIFLLPVAILALIPIIVRWESIVQRFLSLQNIFSSVENSIEWRKSLIRGSFEIFIDNPVFGTGLNTFPFVYTLYQERPGYFSVNPHNYYIQLLTETGVIGFFTFAILALSILYLSFKAFFNSEDIFKGISLGLLVGIISSLIHISLDIDWSVTAIPVMFWIQVGLLMAIYHQVGFKDTRFTEFSTRFNYIKKPVVIFITLAIIIIPSLNYFSLRLYSNARQALLQNELATAEKLNKWAIRLAPWPSGRHHENYAKVLEKQGRTEEALKMIKKSTELDKYNYSYYKTYADLLMKQNPGNSEEALKALKTAVELNPYVHPKLYEDIGDFYINQLSDVKKGIEWYQQAVNIFKTEYLSSYERYSPDDRFQLYRIYRKLSILLSGSNPSLSKEYSQKAAYLLNTQPHTPSGEMGSLTSTVTGTVKSYWDKLTKKQSVDNLLAVDAEVTHPSNEYSYKLLDFTNIENRLFDAKIEYKVLVEKGSLKREFHIVDGLILTDRGWLLSSRDIVKSVNR